MPDNKGCGKHRPKAGVDWSAIEAAVRSGASHNSIAKNFPVSRQRISAKAKKEGWANGKTSLALANGNPDELTFLQWIKLPEFGKITHDTVETILGIIAGGKPESAAVEYCGIPRSTWNLHKEQNETLDNFVRSARAYGELDNFTHIGAAKVRGDWKAAERLLTLNPDHRQTYGDQERVGTKITVNINIPDPGTEIVGEIVACVSG